MLDFTLALAPWLTGAWAEQERLGGTWRFRRVNIEDWINREASPKKDKKT